MNESFLDKQKNPECFYEYTIADICEIARDVRRELRREKVKPLPTHAECIAAVIDSLRD